MGQTLIVVGVSVSLHVRAPSTAACDVSAWSAVLVRVIRTPGRPRVGTVAVYVAGAMSAVVRSVPRAGSDRATCTVAGPEEDAAGEALSELSRRVTSVPTAR